MLPLMLGGAAALIALVAILLHAAGRARARALADDVRAQVEPFLRRKAAETGVPAEAPIWTSRTRPEEIVAYSASLAEKLLDHERRGPQTSTTKEMALAQTQPVTDER